MRTHEKQCFESVMFSKYDGKCTGKFRSDGNTSMETSLLNRVVRWDPASGRAEMKAAMVLRDLGVSEELQLQASAKPLKRRRYRVLQVNHDPRELTVSGPSRPVIRCRLQERGIGPYLRKRPIVAIVFVCDTDHARDWGPRLSRFGMALMWGHS